MTAALLGGVAVAALASSLHCVGMCGAFAAVAGGGAGAEGKRRRWGGVVAYQLGRLFAYGAFGAFAGVLGSGVELAGRTAGLVELAALVAAATLVLLGALALWRALAAYRPAPVGAQVTLSRSSAARRFGRRVMSLFARVHGFVARQPPVWRGLLLGVLSALLPCGLLWAFLVTAAGTATALGGLAVMAVFWAGTVPALLGVGIAAQLLAGKLRRRWALVSPVVLVALGLTLLVWRVQVPVSPQVAAERAAATAADTLGAPAPEAVKCH